MKLSEANCVVKGVVISGNSYHGILISGGSTNQNIAQGNLIGGSPGARNFIGANGNYGVTVRGTDTDANLIRGNSVGITPSGAAAPNTWSGVAISSGARNNEVGGTTPGASNTIANNGSRGVDILDPGTTGNAIRANAIFDNHIGIGIGIYSGASGPPAPSLSAAISGVGLAISGTLTGAPASTAFDIDVFASTGADAFGAFEGKSYLGTIGVTTNGSGSASFNTTIPPFVPAGQFITATASSAGNNTSAFSLQRAVSVIDADSDGIPDAWTQFYFGHSTGLAGDKSRAGDDADGDGRTNAEELRAGTHPLIPSDVLRVAAADKVGADFRLSFPSVQGQVYNVRYRDELASGYWIPLADQIISLGGGSIQITDPGALNRPRRFYDVTTGR